MLKTCGLAHHAPMFEAEGYTLELARKALVTGPETLMSDLRELNLPLGDRRKIVTAMQPISRV